MVMGALTFFLPCGFTITSQSLALISGNWFQSGLIMFFFALGTLPALLLIGVSSVAYTQRPHFAGQFMKIAGVLVLFFAAYNINSQLNVLGLPSLSDLNSSAIGSRSVSDGFPPIVSGKQIVKTDALAFGYEPNLIKVRVGIPVRWEITDLGTSGCTNAIVSRGLFEGQIDLVPGETSVAEFTPETAGKYKFSCWMGMVSGIIEVADSKSEEDVKAASNTQIVGSGAQGCGGSTGSAGCGGGCGGGCGNPGCPYVKK